MALFHCRSAATEKRGRARLYSLTKNPPLHLILVGAAVHCCGLGRPIPTALADEGTFPAPRKEETYSQWITKSLQLHIGNRR